MALNESIAVSSSHARGDAESDGRGSGETNSVATAVVDLATFDAAWYRPGGLVRRSAWFLCNALFLKSFVPYPSAFKRWLLIRFGARVGRNIVIKPCVNIKYPWLLRIGSNVWIGEEAWIDNLAEVVIGDNVCVSQGAYILTGNHDYKLTSFDLIVSPVTIEDGVWVGAKAVVCPGTILKSHSVITVGSVISKRTEAFTIYCGNPARPVRKRELK